MFYEYGPQIIMKIVLSGMISTVYQVIIGEYGKTAVELIHLFIPSAIYLVIRQNILFLLRPF
jgi:hypothetical protein